MKAINKSTGLKICDGAGKPLNFQRAYSFDNNYKLSLVDKIVAFISMFTIMFGIVYATFCG
jgi:hypothetical protein